MITIDENLNSKLLDALETLHDANYVIGYEYTAIKDHIMNVCDDSESKAEAEIEYGSGECEPAKTNLQFSNVLLYMTYNSYYAKRYGWPTNTFIHKTDYGFVMHIGNENYINWVPSNFDLFADDWEILD